MRRIGAFLFAIEIGCALLFGATSLYGVDPEPIVCHVTVREKVIERIDEIAYNVTLKIAIQCPPVSELKVTRTSDGIRIAAIALFSRSSDSKMKWRELASYNSVLTDPDAVSACVPIAKSGISQFDVDAVLDSRETRGLLPGSKVRFIFESTCKDERGRIITKVFNSQPVSVQYIVP